MCYNMTSHQIWEPSGYYREESNVVSFMDDYGYDAHDDLIPDSEAELARIWEDMAEDVGIEWMTEYDSVLDTSDGVEFAHWFEGGRLNATETTLDKWVDAAPDRAMYRWVDETGDDASVSYREVSDRVGKLANALRDHGIEKGDVVGITFPMHPNGFVAAQACLRIGAVFTQIFPGYGPDAMGHRLDDAGAELVITVDGYRRNGEVNALAEKVGEAIEYAPDVSDVVCYAHAGSPTEIDGAAVHDWDAFVEGHETDCAPVAMASDDPALIAYSSGTTGTPKGTIHTHASLLVMGNKGAKYQFDVSEGDTFLWVTDYGWIIVPIWMVAGAPALGATTLLVEGAPFSPTEDRVWEVIEDHGVDVFGIAPTGARTLRQSNPTPREDFDLSTLRILGSTGEPWDEETWSWFLESVGDGEAPIINASGGTELAGAILSPTPDVPLKPGTLYGPAPGVAAEIYDESGEPVDEGYLVVERPFPGMTHSLTSGDERYLNEYWETFDGVWNQNDWAERDEDGFWFITGRADDTMNIAGRRVTAPAIEEVLTGHPAVEGAAVVDVPDDTKGQVPVAFVTLSDPEADADRLEGDITDRVAEDLGAPFRPTAVHVVSNLPRTQTGKIPRDVLRDAYLDSALGNVSTLDNGEVLREFPRRDAAE